MPVTIYHALQGIAGILSEGVIVPRQASVYLFGTSVFENAIPPSDLPGHIIIEGGGPYSEAEATDLLSVSNASGTGDTDSMGDGGMLDL